MRVAVAITITLSATVAAAVWAQTPAAGDRPAATKAQVAEWMQTASTWGKWGPSDQLGAVNYITPEKRKAAAALVRTGEVISLERPIVLQKRHEEIARDGRPNGLAFYEMT